MDTLDKDFWEKREAAMKNLWRQKNVKRLVQQKLLNSRTYRFKSDFGVVLAIGFDDDDIIENAESYFTKKPQPYAGA